MTIRRLHGCVVCNEHVWDEKDKSDKCPVCLSPRYDHTGEPFEKVIHFPLQGRIEALLKLQQYNQSCMWESWRAQPVGEAVTDVYDCQAWKKAMGPCKQDRVTRIGLLFCIDSIPAFNHNEKVGSYYVSCLCLLLTLLVCACSAIYHPQHHVPPTGSDFTHARRIHRPKSTPVVALQGKQHSYINVDPKYTFGDIAKKIFQACLRLRT